jgi:hypothetical protein
MVGQAPPSKASGRPRLMNEIYMIARRKLANFSLPFLMLAIL